MDISKAHKAPPNVIEHYYQRVPGWAAFKDLYMRAVLNAPSDLPSTFVEIGSWLGKSAAYMGVEIMNSRKPIMLHCIDPWQDGGPDLRDTPYYQDLTEPPLVIFDRNINAVKSVVQRIQGSSHDPNILAQFADKSVDFCMIDGDHNYPAVKADIEGWLPKIKPGGMISGDDFLWPGVQKAVREVFGDRVMHTITKKHANYRNTASYWWVQLPANVPHDPKAAA